jgi:hypothetical protein
MNENNLAETCLCNAGIASGNLVMQKNIIDQFYRTSGVGFGAVVRDSSSESENGKGRQQEEEDEEEEEEFKATPKL